MSTHITFGPGDLGGPDDPPKWEDWAYDMCHDASECRRFVDEEFPAGAGELIGELIAHGLPQTQAPTTDHDQQHAERCLDLLTQLQSFMHEWAREQAEQEANDMEIPA